jgi:hypothetical protein
MSVITIRKLHPDVKQRVAMLARINGRSMEGEIRALLTAVVGLGPMDYTGLKQYDELDKKTKANMVAMVGEFKRRKIAKSAASKA